LDNIGCSLLQHKILSAMSILNLKRKTMRIAAFSCMLVAFQVFSGSVSGQSVTLPATLTNSNGGGTGTSCVNAGLYKTGWDGSQYWQYALSSAGYSSLVVRFNSSSSGTGPTSGNVYYNIGSGNVSVGSYVINSTCSGKGPFNLPAACNNASTLYVRLIPAASAGTGTNRVDGSTTASTSPAIVTGQCSTPASYTLTGGPCTGSTLTLSGSASWVRYDLRTGGATVQSIVGTGSAINFTSTSAMGVYTVLATNIATGCTVNAGMAGSVTINTAGVTIGTAPTSTVVCAGDNTSFTASATSAVSYVWQKSTVAGGSIFADITAGMDGGIYGTSFTTTTLDITGASMSVNNYNYRLAATNTCGTVFSSAANLTVNNCNSITTTAAAYGPFCNNTSNAVNVAYTTVGTFTGTFQAELSDPAGSFASPTVIGTGASPISATIPAGVTPGTGYRIRVTNSTPAIAGSNNGSNIIISGPSVGGAAGSNQAICSGTAPAALTLTGNTGSVVKWQSSADAAFTTPSDIPATAGLTTLPGATIGSLSANTYFRAEIQSGVCASEMSSAATVSVVSTPTAISGAATVCVGSDITLSNAIPGGTWSSSNTVAGEITASTGILSGMSAGPTVVAYSNGCAPAATATVTVIAVPAAITGIFHVCEGAGLTVSNTTAGGTWSSSNTAIAAIDAAGAVTGILAGNTDIRYNTGCGIAAVQSLTVVAAPLAISGASSVCEGANITLSNAAASGTWSSSAATIATINTASGIVNGVLAGNAVITYGTGCGSDVTATVTVITTPGVISGASSVCESASVTLSNPVAGGTWSSSNSAVAIVGAASGVVNGILAGTSVIRYTTGCGVDATRTITVLAAPAAIAGASSVCEGLATQLTNTSAGGTWTSSTTTVAVVNASSGIVTGVLAGNTVITYGTGCGTDATKTVTVIAAPSSITGATSLCTGLTTQLSNTAAGGTWSSSITTVATVNATTGVVLGNFAGGVTISYSTGCGVGPIHVMNIIGSPTAIGGAATVCSGLTAQLSESVLGGTWTSSNTTVATVSNTGLVTGRVAGTAVINYSTGCGADVTHTITAIAAPAAIGGAATICAGATAQLSQSVAMGTWSSSNTNVATVNATGLVSAIIAGPVTITYATGCGLDATKALTVIAAPAGISGASSVCNGQNIQLSNTVAGGTWSSNTPAVATVNGSGLVSSVAAGTTVVRYTTGCGTDATKTITVIGVPAAITGPGSVCSGSAISLGNTAVGGVWSSSNSAVATIDAFGNVWATNQGATVIRYTTGCGADVTKTVTVLISPGGIAGLPSVCIGLTLSLSNMTPGGTWSSSTASVATINGSGLVTSVMPGTTTITYSTGCGSDQVKVITVVPDPGTISGPSAVCAAGGVITLSNTVAGGGWNSSNNPVASVNATGDVTGGIAGTAVLSYTTGCGIDATTTITVTPVPGVTLGTTSVCPGSATTLTNGAAGGVWSSDNTAIATVDAGGVVHAIVPGTAHIIYSTGCGTDASASFLVNSSPAAPAPVLGTATVCFGGTTALSSITIGGVWSSDNTAIATVDGVGIVSTIVSGTVNIIYTVTNMCGNASSSALVTAEAPLSTLPAITGTTAFCEGTFASLSNTMAGGAWSSGNTSVATVNSMGLVAGVAAGNAVIAYTAGNTCNTASVTTSVTINPLPAPAPIIGSTAPFCEGTTIALSDPTPGGVWSSNLTSIATISASGVVTGVSGGSSTVFYSLTNGCGTVASVLIVTVDPMPVLSPVTGNLVICAGATTQLSDTATTGAWSSGNTAVAMVSATGLVTGLFAGVAPISYSAVNSCGVITSVATVTVTTTPILGPITGPSTLCVGSSINLANTTPGGTWSTDVITIANVNNLGVVVGLIAGTDTIRYRVSNNCGTSMVARGIEVLPASSCDPVMVGEAAGAVAELKVFPNPNDGVFTWNLLSATNEPAVIVITDVVGKIVSRSVSVTNKENNTILDVPGGVYFISVKTPGGTYNAKITISR